MFPHEASVRRCEPQRSDGLHRDLNLGPATEEPAEDGETSEACLRRSLALIFWAVIKHSDYHLSLNNPTAIIHTQV